jgi:hypothetical protein
MEEAAPKRGFAFGTNARDAARKNHELGTAHRFTSQEAREQGRRGAERRWERWQHEQKATEPSR